MARAVCATLGSEIGVGITGVAGPEPLEGHQPGEVHIGIYDDSQAQSIMTNFSQGREAIKRRAVTNALQLVRRTVLGADTAER
jgi:nicotinamide-nucleotide amidase